MFAKSRSTDNEIIVVPHVGSHQDHEQRATRGECACMLIAIVSFISFPNIITNWCIFFVVEDMNELVFEQHISFSERPPKSVS